MESVVVVTDEKALKCFNENILDIFLKEIETNALNFVGDATTTEGRKQIISKAAEVTKVKTTIEKIGKSLNEERKKLTDVVNADRKKAREFLEDLKTKVREPVTLWEAEEERKIQEEREKVQREIEAEEKKKIEDLRKREEEVSRKEAEFKRLEDERLEKERLERVEKMRIEREARIAREAVERAEREAKEKEFKRLEKLDKTRSKMLSELDVYPSALVNISGMSESLWGEYYGNLLSKFHKAQSIIAAGKAERDKIEAAEHAEREKKEAIEQAKRTEIQRQAREKRIAEEKAEAERVKAEKKADNKAHQKRIRIEALKSFKENGVDSAVAGNVTTLIIGGLIKHITINY